MPDITASIVTLAPQPIAAVQRRMRIAEVRQRIIGLFDIVYRAMRAGQVRPRGHNVALYRPVGGDLFDVSCGVQIAERFAGIGEVIFVETPGGEAATSVHFGEYHQLPHQQVMDWARRSGRRLTGVSWEGYGDWSDDPRERRTDVFHQLVPER